MKKRYLLIILIFLSIFSLFIGVHNIRLSDLINGDMEKISIFLISRVPRLLSILITGISLSIAGVIMQQISSNKFVSPTTAATLDSAQFGVIIAMLLLFSRRNRRHSVCKQIFQFVNITSFRPLCHSVFPYQAAWYWFCGCTASGLSGTAGLHRVPFVTQQKRDTLTANESSAVICGGPYLDTSFFHSAIDFLYEFWYS